jgi:cyanoexosortase A
MPTTRLIHLLRHSLTAPVALLAIALVLIAIPGDSGDFAISVLSMMAVFSILLDRQEPRLRRENKSWLVLAVYTLFALAAGSGIYALLGPINATRALPFLFLLGYWLWHSGRAGIAGQWKPLLILFILAIPDRTLMTPLIAPFLLTSGSPELTHATAGFATWLANLLGLPATLEGLDIHLDNAIVTVWDGCDGGRNMDFLVRLALMLILAFNIRPRRWVLVILTGLAIAFIVNSFRVTLLAYLANIDAGGAFDYWHEGDGSKIFNLTAIILFSIFGYFQLSARKHPDAASSASEPLSQP